jgi:hypothetical protein
VALHIEAAAAGHAERAGHAEEGSEELSVQFTQTLGLLYRLLEVSPGYK